VRAGRHPAFEAVYDRYHRPILAFCAHLLGDRHEAEDAVQHTFMAAYNHLLETDRPIQLRPWLFTIARNRCFTVLRARREVTVAEMHEGEGENPASVVQRREDLRDLVDDLGRLPEEQRAALVMAELGALSHEEIALALEVPREKVKALVFQARESLLATRTAREADCSEIRQELSTQRGPALRRSHLRRHLHACEGCREYRSQLRHQRARLAALLPIVPSAALKDTVLRATVGARAAGASASGGAAAAAGSSALKLALVKPVAVFVLSAAGAVAVVHAVGHRHRPPVLAASRTPVVASAVRHRHGQDRAVVRVRVERTRPAAPARREAEQAHRHRLRWSVRRHSFEQRARHDRHLRRIAAAPRPVAPTRPTRRVPPASAHPAPPAPAPARPVPVPVQAATPAPVQPREAADPVPAGGGNGIATDDPARRRHHHDGRRHDSPTVTTAPGPAADALTTPTGTVTTTPPRRSSERYRVSTNSTRRTAQWPKHNGPLRGR
jgi:RNA polymerase sigma factor (sigma-70 family)